MKGGVEMSEPALKLIGFKVGDGKVVFFILRQKYRGARAEWFGPEWSFYSVSCPELMASSGKLYLRGSDREKDWTSMVCTEEEWASLKRAVSEYNGAKAAAEDEAWGDVSVEIAI